MRKEPKVEKKPDDKDFYVKLTYPYNRPGPGDRKDPEKDLSKYKEFNYAYPSVTDFHDIKWKLIECCAVTNEGNKGVIFIHSKDGNFVLKGSADPAVEYFGNLLFQELQIQTPRIEILPFDDPRFKLAVSNLDRATYFDQNIKHRVRSRLDRPYLLLMEYIPGLRIQNLGVQRTKDCFDTSYPDGRDRLIRIGITLITDVFINNMDRYPLFWKNNGNADNLVIKFDTDFNTKNEELFDKNNLFLKMTGLCAVDNKPNLMTKDTKFSEDNYLQYLDKVEELVHSIFYQLALVRDGKLNPFDNSTKRFEYVSLVSTFIYNHTSVDVRPLGELQILLGMALGMMNIATLGMDIIENLRNKVQKTITNDWKGFWVENCQAIKLDLLIDIMKIYTKYTEKCNDIIGWANTITLNQYLIKVEKNQGTGENDSSVLSVHDENEEPDQQPPVKSDIDAKYEDLLDKKVYEFFGVDFAEKQPTQQNFGRNSLNNFDSKRGSQNNIDSQRDSQRVSKRGSQNGSPERLHDSMMQQQQQPQPQPQEIPKEEPKEIPKEEPPKEDPKDKKKKDKSKSPEKDKAPEEKKKKKRWF